jgi:hypothetical protein
MALVATGCSFDPSGLGGSSFDSGPGLDSASGDAVSGGDATADDADPSAFAAWSKTRLLTIDNSGIGQLASFAVLVVLNSGRISYGQAKADGSDLRFTTPGGQMLAHEIEQWNASGISRVWVRVPTILEDTTTDLWMYYGNTAATDPGQGTQVWDTSFVGVWHLDGVDDSTGGNISSNQGATSTGGAVGNAMDFDGNDSIDTGAGDNLNVWSIELWMRPSAAAEVTISSGPISRGLNYQMQWDCGSSEWCRSVNMRLAPATPIIAVYGDPTPSTWFHVAGTFDGTNLRTYLNGALTNTLSAVGNSASETGTAKLGARVDLTGFYSGAVDEARISRVARSADYFAAHYKSTTDTYIAFGQEMTQ